MEQQQKRRYKRSYVDEFLSLRCASDVLEAVQPLRDPVKSISESMALISAIRGLCLKRPRAVTIIDVCSGDALTGILAAHLLPVLAVYAVGEKNSMREGYGRVRNFSYSKVASLD